MLVLSRTLLCLVLTFECYRRMKFFADSGVRELAGKLSPRADVSAVFFVHDEARQRAGKGPEEELRLIVRVLVWQEAHHHGGCQVVELLNFGAAPDGGRSVLRLRASKWQQQGTKLEVCFPPRGSPCQLGITREKNGGVQLMFDGNVAPPPALTGFVSDSPFQVKKQSSNHLCSECGPTSQQTV